MDRESLPILRSPGLDTDFQREYSVFITSQYTEDDVQSTLENVFDGENPITTYGKKFMELSEKHPDSPTAVQALVRAVALLSRASDFKSRGLLVKAVDELEEKYLDSSWIGEAAVALAASAEPRVIALQKKIIQESSNRDARGIACYALATNLQASNAYMSTMQVEVTGDKQPEYVALINRAIEEYGDVRLRKGTLKTLLKPTLAISQTGVGVRAPEMEGVDFDGNPMSLKEHQGKVVVLDFWVDWCPYCRQMYPHNKQLVQKYEGQSFALLGINGDQGTRGSQAHFNNSLPYPSFYDGESGPIGEQWGIDGYPTMVVLDKRGVIRERLSTTDFATLDAIVHRLMNEGDSLTQGDVLPLQSEWKYWDQATPPVGNWQASEFDDRSWQTGAAPFGFGLDQRTELRHGEIGEPQPMCYYFRKEFRIDDLQSISDLIFESYHDDGVVIYVNGQELVRRLVPLDAGHDTPAALDRRGQGRTASYTAIDKKHLKPGMNVVAVQVHQATEWSADLRFDLAISSDALKSLTDHLTGSDATKRDMALVAAADLGESAKSLTSKIRPLLKAEDANTRTKAYAVLLGAASRQRKEAQSSGHEEFPRASRSKAAPRTCSTMWLGRFSRRTV